VGRAARVIYFATAAAEAGTAGTALVGSRRGRPAMLVDRQPHRADRAVRQREIGERAARRNGIAYSSAPLSPVVRAVTL
jgi:hypothetical protein